MGVSLWVNIYYSNQQPSQQLSEICYEIEKKNSQILNFRFFLFPVGPTATPTSNRSTLGSIENLLLKTRLGSQGCETVPSHLSPSLSLNHSVQSTTSDNLSTLCLERGRESGVSVPTNSPATVMSDSNEGINEFFF